MRSQTQKGQIRPAIAAATVAVYTDGGVIASNPSPAGGTWSFVYVDKNDVQIYERAGVIDASGPWARRTLGGLVTNNLTEFVAMLCALEALPAGWCGMIVSDSLITIGRFFDGAPCNGIPVELIRRKDAAVSRLGACSTMHVSGHPSRADLAAGHRKGRPVSVHNMRADALCTMIGRRLMAGDIREFENHERDYLTDPA